MASKTRTTIKFVLIIFWFPLFSACRSSEAPETVEIGKDQCSQCRMTIMDGRYAAELVTKTGKALKFDSSDCLLNHLHENPSVNGKTYVGDFLHDGELVSTADVHCAPNENPTAPMGTRYVCFIDKKDGRKPFPNSTEPYLKWDELIPR